MALSGNHQLPGGQRRPKQHGRYKTHLNQPARKLKRRMTRKAKAAAVAPRPLQDLHPIVRCQTRQYNMRLRYGRGFSLDELKAAGISKKIARTIGIAVDHRRKNRTDGSLERNAERLREYQAKLVLFPKRRGKQVAGDATREQIATATQFIGKQVLPMTRQMSAVATRAITDEDMKVEAHWGPRRAKISERIATSKAGKLAAKEAAA